MDKGTKDKLVRSPGEMEKDRMPKKIFTQELEGQDEGEDPGKDGKKKQREIFKCWE